MITRLSVQHSPAATVNGNKQPVPTSPQPAELMDDRSIMSPGSYHSFSPTQGDQYSETASSSSPSNTDSDSLSSIQQRENRNSIANKLNINNNNNNNINITPPQTKSPILIKYNYYDYNGARQEQANHDMNYQVGARVQRNLSPTFKQNLDQIVRSSQQQQQMQLKQHLHSTPPSSPEQNQDQMMIHFARRYKLSSYEQRCLRCNKTVYQMDKVGPLKDFTFYHQNCFKCRECGTKLTLKTYFNNQQLSNDHEVYCHRHCPKTGPGKLDNQSVGIRAALNAPKVFELTSAAHQMANLAGGNLTEGEHLQQPLTRTPVEYGLAANGQHLNNNHPTTPNVDSRALYIQHAVQQTRLQNIYKQSQVDQKISQFINRRLEFLEPKQKLLEMQHRQEEDALFKTFELKWLQEESCISEQIREEWQAELCKLLEKHKRQLSNISAGGHNQQQQQNSNHHHHQQVASAVSGRANGAVGVNSLEESARLKSLLMKQLATSEQQPVASQQSAQAPSPLQQQTRGSLSNNPSKQQMIEFERMNLEKTMTIKLDRKKETLKRKLKEFERQATAELVEKQSREMLALISMKLEEYKEEQKRKIGSDLEQFEAIESLANQLGSSLQLTVESRKTGSLVQLGAPPLSRELLNNLGTGKQRDGVRYPNEGARFEAPPPKPPLVSKMELYNSDEPDEVFRDIDQLAINVAREDQRTFTDLVHHLTRHCLTDIEKVRAIFRWITVKNLNTMQFDSSVKPDTPLGLLRGIKNGSESYHVLFKRLCSYAGLHCVVIKGYSKSAGYQPGVKFEGNRFRNSWNAVYVANAWRFVQCNWGARHLVSVAVMQDKSQPSKRVPQVENLAPTPAETIPVLALKPTTSPISHAAPSAVNAGRSQQQQHHHRLTSPNHGRRGLAMTTGGANSMACNNRVNMAHFEANLHQHHDQLQSPSSVSAKRLSSPKTAPTSSPPSSSSSSSSSTSSPLSPYAGTIYSAALDPANMMLMPKSKQVNTSNRGSVKSTGAVKKGANDSLRYEYDDHYFLTDPDEFIYEFYPLLPEWQLVKARPITLAEFEQLPFVRSLFFKYGLYFPQHDIRSVLNTDSSGATTIKIGMPTHMIPSLIFHYNLKYYDSDAEHYEGISLKRFVMQSVELGTSDSSSGAQVLLSNIVTFRVHLPENGAYILDIFANSTTPTQYITGEPMKFKSVCKFKIIAKGLKTCMIPLPDCASGEYGPMKATRLFGIIPITHESGLISVQNEKRFLEIQFRMTRPLLDFMASLHKNGYDERQLSKSIKIFVDGDIVYVTVKFFEDGQYGLDIYTRDNQLLVNTKGANVDRRRDIQQTMPNDPARSPTSNSPDGTKKQLLTHCCKYLVNVRTPQNTR